MRIQIRNHYFKWILAFIYFNIRGEQAGVAISATENYLLQVADNIDGMLKKEQESDICRWYEPKSAIDTITGRNKITKYFPPLPSSSSNDSGLQSIMIHTDCFSLGSLGNDLSQYIETRLCAEKSRVHFVATALFHNKDLMNHPFFKSFPRIVIHPNATNDMSLLQKQIGNLCPCPSSCHEWHYGLMHNHMHDFAKKIFSTAINNYWESLSQQTHDTGIILNTYSRVSKNDVVYHGDRTKEKIHSEEKQMFLPLVPDVAIHYRCGRCQALLYVLTCMF